MKTKKRFRKQLSLLWHFFGLSTTESLYLFDLYLMYKSRSSAQCCFDVPHLEVYGPPFFGL